MASSADADLRSEPGSAADRCVVQLRLTAKDIARLK